MLAEAISPRVTTRYRPERTDWGRGRRPRERPAGPDQVAGDTRPRSHSHVRPFRRPVVCSCPHLPFRWSPGTRHGSGAVPGVGTQTRFSHPLLSRGPLFRARAWRCLRLGLAFRVVAIPQSGLLAQVSSLRLPLGHSGQILTLSNAGHASLPSPCLLVAGAGICAASPLGELPLGS